MAYEGTEISVGKSQEGIRKTIYGHSGIGINFLSQPPREGFEAAIPIEKVMYHVRIMAQCKTTTRDKKPFTEKQREQEERRVWRVLYWHLKAMFEAADSGVIDIRDVILPYVVTKDGRVVGEHLKERMKEMMTMNPARMLHD